MPSINQIILTIRSFHMFALFSLVFFLSVVFIINAYFERLFCSTHTTSSLFPPCWRRQFLAQRYLHVLNSRKRLKCKQQSEFESQLELCLKIRLNDSRDLCYNFQSALFCSFTGIAIWVENDFSFKYTLGTVALISIIFWFIDFAINKYWWIMQKSPIWDGI